MSLLIISIELRGDLTNNTIYEIRSNKKHTKKDKEQPIETNAYNEGAQNVELNFKLDDVSQ